jgi:Flp pilus assembly protein TadD
MAAIRAFLCFAAACAAVAGGVAPAQEPPKGASRGFHLALIEDLRRSGKPHAALAHLDAFDKQYPRAADAAVLRGDCLVDLKDFAGAAAVYRTLLGGPQAAAAQAGLARVEALNGRWPMAADHYARAVALAPTQASYLNDYGFALLNAGRAGDALFRLQQAAELAPADAKVRNNLILALDATGDRAGAQRLLASVPDAGERAEIAAELAKRQAGRQAGG